MANYRWYRRASDIPDHAICIKKGVRNIFYRNIFYFAHHGYCTYHLQNNMKTIFSQSGLKTLFRIASKAYTVTKFVSNILALDNKKRALKSTD